MINYLKESENYRPPKITTLLVGEAPPHSGRTYFYVPALLRNKTPICQDRSLPATIFHHFFKRRPESKEKYISMLNRLRSEGIFLVDIVDEAIKVRGDPEGMKKVKEGILNLRKKLKERDIIIEDNKIIFLLARSGYERNIKEEFPDARREYWICFRLNPTAQPFD